MIHIIADEHHLRSDFQNEDAVGRVRRFGELVLHVGLVRHFLCRQVGKVCFVDCRHYVAARGYGHSHIVAGGVRRVEIAVDAVVDCGKVGRRRIAAAHAVEQGDELFVALSVYLAQFDRHQGEVAEHPRSEEVEALIVAAQYLARLRCYDRFQLEYVAHHQYLLAGERLALVAAEVAEQLVHEVDDVGAYHRNLVDDNQLQRSQHLYETARVVHALRQVGLRKFAVVVEQRLQRYVEKRVQCLSSGIDGGNARRGEHHILLVRMLRDVFQKCRFASAGLAGHEHRVVGEFYQRQYLLKFIVVQIYFGHGGLRFGRYVDAEESAGRCRSGCIHLARSQPHCLCHIGARCRQESALVALAAMRHGRKIR